MIPEWLSFRNKIIPSLYISVYLFMWCRNNISFLYKSFLNEFIPVFNPIEILILVSCKLKLRSGWKITNLVVWGMCTCLSDLGWNHLSENVSGRAIHFCHVNTGGTPVWGTIFVPYSCIYCKGCQVRKTSWNLQVHLQLQFTCLQGTPHQFFS